jgi:molecular chaperone HtpG
VAETIREVGSGGPAGEPVDRAFRVDLRGVVDLLSHHLYSSPQVYLRELVQNAVDAVTARRAADPAAPGRVLVVPSDVAADGRLHCVDTGCGLSPDDVERFLATIGSSSKRDELGLARADLLGQFGIGLLSCFLVADGIELVTTPAGGGPTTRWVGRSDGGYTVTVLDADAAAQERAALAGLVTAAGAPDLPTDAGTWVRLLPRRDTRGTTSAGEVGRLARRFAQMLPVEVCVARPDGSTERVTRDVRPWDGDARSAAQMREEAAGLLGVPVLAVLPVTVRTAGLRGVVAILGRPTAPSSKHSHHVYAKGMLVGTGVEGLLPEWAFFARALVDADGLRLTASREALYDDDLLAEVRAALGEHLRRWLLRTAEVAPQRFAEVLGLHELGMRALAVHDDDLYRAYAPVMTVETSVGTTTLADVLRRFDVVRWTATTDEFRQVLPVASAQGLGVVNAGYSFQAELMERLALVDPDVRALQVVPGDLDAHVDLLDDDVLAGYAHFLEVARETLGRLDVDVEVRSFTPSSLPALVLDDRESAHRRSARAAADDADDAWAGLLAALDDGGRSQIRLLLNHEHPVVRRLTTPMAPQVLALTAEALWCQALLLGQRPLRPVDQAVMNRSFVGLLELATGSAEEGDQQ